MGLYQNVLESADGGVFINIRDAAGTGITSTLVSGKQALDVNVANSIMVGTPDETAFTYGTSNFQPVGGVFQDTSPGLSAGQSGAARLTQNRALHVNLRTPAGAAVGDLNSDGLWIRPGDGTNAQAYASSGEAFSTVRQGGNVANVNASNQLLTLEGNAGSILSLMTPTTGTITSVAVTATSATMLSLNTARKGWSAQNDTNKTIYIATNATSTSSAYSVRLAPNGYYESLGDRVYTGVLSVIGAASVAGNVTVTEYT
jgi:hypothetical protein